MKTLYIDVETTGVDEKRHAIHQLSGILVINGYAVRQFNYYLKPFEGAEITPEALEVGGVTLEQIMAYPDQSEGYEQLMQILDQYCLKFNKTDKIFFAGYNAGFDNRFIRELFTRNGNNFFGSYFWAGTIDLMVLALDKLAPVRHEMENFKLVTTAKKLGIKVDETRLHDSEYDIWLTRQMHGILKNGNV